MMTISKNLRLEPNNDVLLKVEHLNAGYGKRQVLFDMSFQVNRGEIVLLIGGNGSGKSTFLKAIYGLVCKWDNPEIVKKLSPSVQFAGEDISNTKPHELIRKGLVYVPQKNNTFEQLSVIENLEIVAMQLCNKTELKKRINAVFEKLPQLETLKSRTPFHLSGGEKQQLALGMALMLKPKMIMLDEPGAGLAPNKWQQNLAIINTLNQQGISFLIVEHRVKETAEKAHNVLLMKLGRLATS